MSLSKVGRRFAVAIPVASATIIASLGLTGCGGSGRWKRNRGPGQNFQLGSTQLDVAIQTLGNSQNGNNQVTEDTVSQVAAASNYFSQAYATDPKPVYAIAFALASTLRSAGTLASFFVQSGRSEDDPLDLPSFIVDWGENPAAFVSGKTVVNGLFLTRLGQKAGRGFPAEPAVSGISGNLTQIRQNMTDILKVLTPEVIAQIESAPLIVDDPNSTDPAVKVAFGKVEALRLKTFAHAVLGLTELGLAYDLDWNGYTGGNLFSTVLSESGIVDLNAFLPAANFGALKPGAGLKLASIRSEWEKALDALDASMTAFSERVPLTGGNRWLTDSVGGGNVDNAQVRADIAAARAALNERTAIGSGNDRYTFDLSAFLNNAPSNLKTVFPALAVNFSTSTATIEAGSAATFGGLFPNGTFGTTFSATGTQSKADVVNNYLNSVRDLKGRL